MQDFLIRIPVLASYLFLKKVSGKSDWPAILTSKYSAGVALRGYSGEPITRKQQNTQVTQGRRHQKSKTRVQ